MAVNPQANHEAAIQNSGLIQRFLLAVFPEKKARTEVSGHSREVLELIGSLKEAKREWADATMNFDYVDDQEMVDYYTYKIKACEIRYEYFLRKIKERGVKVDIAEEENSLP